MKRMNLFDQPKAPHAFRGVGAGHSREQYAPAELFWEAISIETKADRGGKRQ